MKRHSRRHFIRGAAGGVGAAFAAPLLGRLPVAVAAGPTCPNPIKAVHENRCTDTASWTTDFQLKNYNGAIVAFAASTSWDIYEVESNPARNPFVVHAAMWGAPSGGVPAQIRIYRLGYYGGKGARLVYTRNITLNAPGGSPPMDPQTGLLAFQGAERMVLSDFVAPASGVYLARIVTNTGGDSHFPFIVRDDRRARDVLVAMPTNTWLAYNNWAGKSLYDIGDMSGGDPETVAGTNPASGGSRAVKVSYDRPWSNQVSKFDWLLHTEFPLVYWLERMGYDLAYTEDVAVHLLPDQLLPAKSKAYVIAGHSEYWTQEMYDAVKAARAAGTHVAGFGANTAYWRVRYQDGERTVVCYKTIQGTGGQAGGGAKGVNDPQATASPPRPTTTSRDRGAAAGAAEAPPEGRVGVSQPENEVFGIFYVGDDGGASHPLNVPSGAGAGGEFGAHRAWRNTTVANGGGATIGSSLVGWEWDAVPSSGALHALARSKQPANVKRLAETDPTVGATGSASYLIDDGRARAATPPAGISKNVNMAIHTAPSGAIVFAAGTMQLSWALGPHYGGGPNNTYLEPRHDDSDPRIQQLVYNVLADMKVTPYTPEGVTLDGAPTHKPPKTRVAGASAQSSASGGARVLQVANDGALRLFVYSADEHASNAQGTLILRANGAARSSVPGGGRSQLLAKRSFRIRDGRPAAVALHLPSKHRKLLEKRRRLAVTAETISTDGSGNRTIVRTPLVLVAPKKLKA